jgi:hypothetical protein
VADKAAATLAVRRRRRPTARFTKGHATRVALSLSENEMTSEKPTWRILLGTALLCLLAGSALLLDDVAPSPLSGFAADAVRDSLAAVVAYLFSFCLPQREWRAASLAPSFRMSALSIVAWGAVLLAGLPLLFAFAGSRVSGGTELLLFAAIPAAVVFLRAQAEAGFGADDTSRHLLLPALAGIGGAGLLLHWTLPARAEGLLWLLAMVAMAVLSGFAIIRLAQFLHLFSLAQSTALVFAGTALAQGCMVLLTRRALSFAVLDRSILLQEGLHFVLHALIVVLSLWLLRALGPIAYSARYLLVLLVALAESFLVARARLTWTIGLGACLMLGSGWILLRAPQVAAQDADRESHSS